MKISHQVQEMQKESFRVNKDYENLKVQSERLVSQEKRNQDTNRKFNTNKEDPELQIKFQRENSINSVDLPQKIWFGVNPNKPKLELSTQQLNMQYLGNPSNRSEFDESSDTITQPSYLSNSGIQNSILEQSGFYNKTYKSQKETKLEEAKITDHVENFILRQSYETEPSQHADEQDLKWERSQASITYIIQENP